MTVTDHRSTGPTDVDGGRGDGAWAVLLPAGRYDAERLVHHDALELTLPAGAPALRPGDPVAVLADEPPRLVALGRVTPPRRADVAGDVHPAVVRHAGAGRIGGGHRAGQRPRPGHLPRAGRPARPAAATPHLAGQPRPADRGRVAGRGGPALLVVRAGAGSGELPAFVSPSGDELAMQAFVLGVEANQDPEEDD